MKYKYAEKRQNTQKNVFHEMCQKTPKYAKKYFS
jgi:hypothetical protein